MYELGGPTITSFQKVSVYTVIIWKTSKMTSCRKHALLQTGHLLLRRLTRSAAMDAVGRSPVRKRFYEAEWVRRVLEHWYHPASYHRRQPNPSLQDSLGMQSCWKQVCTKKSFSWRLERIWGSVSLASGHQLHESSENRGLTGHSESPFIKSMLLCCKWGEK